MYDRRVELASHVMSESEMDSMFLSQATCLISLDIRENAIIERDKYYLRRVSLHSKSEENRQLSQKMMKCFE